MKVQRTSLNGVLMITPNIFTDYRGAYVETYNKHEYQLRMPPVDFVQDDISVSRYGTLRGIHGDDRTWKLVTCLWGEFYLVVVNYDESSPQYKQWAAFTLSHRDDYRQVLIPPKFGNAHLVLSRWAIFHYKQSTYYEGPENQFTLKWDDPELDIYWPMKPTILSQRDS